MKRKAISKTLGLFLAGVITLSSVPGMQVSAEGETEVSENVEVIGDTEETIPLDDQNEDNTEEALEEQPEEQQEEIQEENPETTPEEAQEEQQEEETEKQQEELPEEDPEEAPELQEGLLADPEEIEDETIAEGRGGTDYSKEQSTRGFVYRMYNVVLGREPEEDGLQYWVSRLNNGSAYAVDIVSGFFESSEYHNKKKSNNEIVTDCYKAMLGRNPDEAGYRYWLDRLDIGMTPEAIFAGFVDSREFTELCEYYGIQPGEYQLTAARDQNYEKTYFVYRMYKNCLGRTPDADGLEAWCGYLNNGGAGSNVAYGFIFSDEYWGKHTDNTAFVSMLYQSILGRTGEKEGMAGWVDQLNYTSTREHVMNGFLYSQEFAQQCVTAEINVGDPVAEPDNGTEWQYNIHVLALCNEQRNANGLDNLVTQEDVWRDVAMVRAEECSESFSHTRPDGSSCWTAYEEAGIKRYSAENIAAGYSSPQNVVNAWMNSVGHRSNILGNSKVLATGYYYAPGIRYKHFWSQNFTR